MDAITQPATCPAAGVTFVGDSFDVFRQSIMIGIQGLRRVRVFPIDCFPHTRFATDARFTHMEMAMMETALSTAKASEAGIVITVPEPNQRSSAWLQRFLGNAPKPGWVWVDSAETLNEQLVGAGLRSPLPDHPIDGGFPDPVRPAIRPAPGLTMAVDRAVRVESQAADVWRIQTHSGIEMVVSLIDCYCRPGDQDAYDAAWDLMEQSSTLAMTLPQPSSANDWLGSLVPGSEHAGWLWLDESTTLNQKLVQSGYASQTPFA